MKDLGFAEEVQQEHARSATHRPGHCRSRRPESGSSMTNNRIEPIPAWTIEDMCIATGKDRKTVMKLIDAGELPGVRFKAARSYSIPALWALAWMEGRWQPATKETEETEEIAPLALVRRVRVA